MGVLGGRAEPVLPEQRCRHAPTRKDNFLNTNKNTAFSADVKRHTEAPKAFITGCGRAVPGVDGLTDRGGLVDSQIIMDRLLELGVYNPRNGQPVSPEFARRNLEVEQIAIANLSDFQKGFPKSSRSNAIDASEWDLAGAAIQIAMDEAAVQVEQLDAVLHVSPTLRLPSCEQDDMGLHHCMRRYPDILPGLRQDCLLQHQDSGCSGVVPPFQLAKAMLTSGDFQRILVVCSTSARGRADVEYFASQNDLSKWINYLLFGDAACAFILSRHETAEEALAASNALACYELLSVNSATRTDFYIAQSHRHVGLDKDGGRVGCKMGMTLNPHAAKHVFTKQLFEWLARQSIDAAQLDALIVHQPNASVVTSIQKITGADKVHNIARKYGNLVCASLGVQFYEQLSTGKTKVKNKSLIAGFTLGAHAGMTFGGFIAQAHCA
jgi:3-oxoacyl-[acyl-carrier-protein] synthase III